jgi:hypothetical protein
MVVVLGLDESDGEVRLVVENVVGALSLFPSDEPAANDDPALGELELDLVPDLG